MKKLWWLLPTALLAAGSLVFLGCPDGGGGGGGGGNGSGGGSRSKAIQLSGGVWAEGNIPKKDGEQWFKFTATGATQYIHVSFGTLKSLEVKCYDADDEEEEEEVTTKVLTNLSPLKYTSISVTSGKTYYIQVTPVDSWTSTNNKGTYKIAFNDSSTAPATP